MTRGKDYYVIHHFSLLESLKSPRSSSLESELESVEHSYEYILLVSVFDSSLNGSPSMAPIVLLTIFSLEKLLSKVVVVFPAVAAERVLPVNASTASILLKSSCCLRCLFGREGVDSIMNPVKG